MVKRYARIVALLLALVFCFSFLACTKPDDTPDDTSNNNESSASTDGADSSAGTTDDLVADDLPDLNFNNSTVNFLYWSDVEKLEFEPKANGDWDMSNVVEKAMHDRNENVQNRLGVKLNFIPEAGNAKNIQGFLTRVKLDYETDREFDIIATYSRTAGKVASNGYYRDLSNNKYINVEKPWYPEGIINNLYIGDSLYFLSGDASVNTLYLMYTIYYNKDLIKYYSLEDPQSLVDNKQWTVDKLIEMTTNTYQNLNGDENSKQDEEDFYGFCTVYFGADAFYTGAGFKLVDNTDKDALLKIHSDFSSEQVVNFTEKLGRWLTSQDCNVSTASNGNYRKPFVNGTAIFCQERCYLAENYLLGSVDGSTQGVDFKYGILPTPLRDESQSDYITCIGNPFTLYGIARACGENEIDMLGAVIECWSSESYRLTTPALFEIQMQLRYAKEEKDAQMFDICKRTLTTDFGRVFGDDLRSGSYMSEIWSKAVCGSYSSWKTTSSVNLGVLRNKVKALVDEFKEMMKTN